MVWLRDDFEDMFTRFDKYTNVTDRWTNGQTQHDGIGSAYA